MKNFTSFKVEINGYSLISDSLQKIKNFVDDLKSDGRVKGGDFAVIYPSTSKSKTFATFDINDAVVKIVNK